MRNLKRALSLALASVMLLGMMVVGSSAAAYPDVAGNEHEEAIAVMQLLGVMTGDEKGNFNPDKPVTRNEMAVIMVNLMNLKLTGAHPFTDVPAWADKYVAAVYANGVTSGTSATTYGGDDTLTAAQAALMVMKTLGYFEYDGEFGDDWKVATVKRATELDLFDDIDANVDAAMTRAELAHLVFNALGQYVVVVREEGGMSVEGNGITVNQKATYTYAPVEPLFEKLFDDDVDVDSTTDNFKRPGVVWSYDGDEVTVIDTPTKTYVGAVEVGTIYKDLKLDETLDTNDQKVYEDGVVGTAIDIEKKGDDEYGAAGQIVELYYDEDAATPLTVVIINTYLGVIVDNEAKGDDDEKGVKIDIIGGASGKFYETAVAYEEDDLVLVTYANSKVQEIVGTPKTVTGDVTRKGDDYVTVGGTKYTLSDSFETGTIVTDEITGIAVSAVAIDEDNTYTLYLDNNGAVLAIEEVETAAETDLVYVYSVEEGSTLDGKKLQWANYAVVVYMDGTTKELLIGETKDNEDDLASLSSYEGAFATLSYDEDDDEYTLSATLEDDNAEKTMVAGKEIKTDSKYVKLDDSKNYYLNSKTTYIFVTVDDEDDTIDEIDVKTGAISYKTESGKFVADKNNRVLYVVVESEYSSAAKDVVYVDDGENKGEDANGWIYEVYMDKATAEKEVTIARVNDSKTTGTDLTAGYYEYTVNNKGALVLTTLAEDVTTGAEFDSYTDNFWGIYDMTDMVIVDLTDADDASENSYGYNVTSLSALKRAIDKDNKITADILVDADDEVIVTMYITKIENA